MDWESGSDPPSPPPPPTPPPPPPTPVRPAPSTNSPIPSLTIGRVFEVLPRLKLVILKQFRILLY